MFRLILLVTAVSLLIALPLLAIPSAAEQGGPPSEAKSLFSVVSHRGVRVRLAQQPAPPTDAAPAPLAAEPSAAEDADAAIESPADKPRPTEPDAAVEGESTPPPAAEGGAVVAEEDPFEDETPAPAPAVAPDICGPVRARIDDLSEEPGPVQTQKSDRPITKEAFGPVRAQIKDVQQKGKSCDVCQRGGTHGKSVSDGKGGTHGKSVKDGKGGKGHGVSVKGSGFRCAGGIAGKAHGGKGIGSARGGKGIGSAHGGKGILAGRRANGRGAGGNCAGGQCGPGPVGEVIGSLLGRDGFCCTQMYQHYAYYPAMHGYYYFRPYNHSEIPEQQRIAAEWGEDPRHPYANDLFQVVYADYLREQQAANEPAIEVPPPVDPIPPPVPREQN